ncbi:hypothetical protein Tco_1186469 [Tanacetum coccineum]
MSRVLFSRITKTLWEHHEEAAVSYADLKASIDTYYDENIAHRDQTDKLLLKEINTAVKDDPAMNKKINEAIETFDKISTNTTEILSLVKDIHFATIQSTVNGLQAQALKQEKVSVAWTTSSTNMARNLGSRMTVVELSQTALQHEISSLKQDTSKIKSMMKEIYQAVKGQPSSVPPGSVTPTLALTHIQANVEGENATHTATEDPPSHTEGENDANIETTDQRKLVNASSIGRPDLDAPVLVPYKINGKLHYLTDKQIQEYLDKEEQIMKAEEEARLIAISKPEVIKVVREEAKKLGIHPKEETTTKAGETFKKTQDAEHAVLKKQHTEKVRKSLELIKHKYVNYMWTINSRLKPEPITDIKIHPKTKPVVITVYKGTDGRHFDVHNPFLFGDFGISELDELREIIPKKKNAVSLNKPHPKPLEEKGSIWNWNLNISRWSDINKVGMKALVSYLVAASMVKSPENARFSMKLRKLIAQHPDQEKLKSKRVKLEALGYKMD